MRPRFDYGKTKPWLRMQDGILICDCRPSCPRADRRRRHCASTSSSGGGFFTPKVGERLGFVLTHRSSWEASPDPVDPAATLEATDDWWREWSGRSTYAGGWADEVERSLITLKALTYAPTRRHRRGGHDVAARVPRRRAQLGLPVLLAPRRGAHPRRADGGRLRRRGDELAGLGGARRRRRSRGHPDHVRARRRAPARRVRAAAPQGYEGSAPVRIGNAASGQLQLDVYGEVIDAIYRRTASWGCRATRTAKSSRGASSRWLEEHWREPDDGVWEVRGGRKQFVHSKVMAWVAVDRVLKMARGRTALRGRRLIACERSATRSTRRSVARATTPSATRSRSTTGRSSSTPRCC